eukprot:gnl/TRDRNA2_/TRDRNA2_86511_c0_seq1.p1 gnl/TRDRNA2_/TRDRNA2_86511_c0~~gnl/TRDRNA2_/TRDRNA2_86511_c0_seq1.p1  ORF type:complete len:244 (+),score=37.23 gnl/TRDRNA2_/TRDRNA2_86511_c0_seq1:61-792(+)
MPCCELWHALLTNARHRIGCEEGCCEALRTASRRMRAKVVDRYERQPRTVIAGAVWGALVVIDGCVMAVAFVFIAISWWRHLHTGENILLLEEVSSQVMCALFLFQALVVQPSRLIALWLLLRDFRSLLRRRGPPEIARGYLSVIIVLLNLNCWLRFANVYFMWWFIRRPALRPAEWELGTLLASILCGVIGMGLEGYFMKRGGTSPASRAVEPQADTGNGASAEPAAAAAVAPTAACDALLK